MVVCSVDLRFIQVAKIRVYHNGQLQASLLTVLQQTHDGYIIYTYTSMSFCNSNFDTCYDVYDHAVA